MRMLEQTRKAIVEVFGDFLGDNPMEATRRHTYTGKDDPGGWSPQAAVVIHTETFLPSIDEGIFMIEKWDEVSDKLDGHFVEHINGGVSAVYKI